MKGPGLSGLDEPSVHELHRDLGEPRETRVVRDDDHRLPLLAGE